jgi:hypothetical protein
MLHRLPWLIALVLLAAVTAFTAAPARASEAASRASSVSYPDSAGEDPAAPDITRVVVSNDDRGVLTLDVGIANRPQLGPDMVVAIFLDTDRNLATGDGSMGLGADYMIGLGSGAVALGRWNDVSKQYDESVPQSSLVYSYGATGATIKVDAKELGNPTGFAFLVSTISGLDGDDAANVHLDLAPDIGHGSWAYTLKVKQPALPKAPAKKKKPHK